MPASKLTYPTKTNNPSDPDNVRKFLFNEANDIKNAVNDHADRIDLLEDAQLTQSLNPYYGKYTSLAILQAAHTTGETNAWAIIDEGPGITPLIAYWDSLDEVWKISNNQNDKVDVATFSSLPAPGLENIWYLTLDSGYLYRWYNNQYNLVGAAAANEVRIQGALVETLGKTNLNQFEVGDKFRIWNGDYRIEGIVSALPFDINDRSTYKQVSKAQAI